MTSSALERIETSPVRDVRIDNVRLTVTLADGRSIATPLEWYPRLALGTPQERANWHLIGDGEAVRWPDLDEDIGVDGLIAGRKSGEGAASLKRWMAIQETLRRMPHELRDWRRDVLHVGKLPAKVIAKRALEAADAYEIPLGRWCVGVAADPFGRLAQRGLTDDSALAVFQAESSDAARQAMQQCAAAGMRPLGDDDVSSDEAAYLFILAADEIGASMH